MSAISIGLLAISMSIDAFFAAIGRGTGTERPGFGRALRTGLVFGLVETTTPLLGWALGYVTSDYVEAFDHWIAFGLLGAVGAHMIANAFKPRDEEDTAPKGLSSRWALVATAFGTSIDAMAVGVSLAFLDVNILVVASAIGIATLLMSTGGVLAGRFLGSRFGPVADVFGGLVLVGLGTMILVEHLTA